ncbi:MAG TPA: molybdenum cofactor biosynthesis protein MoaE [Candidatus Paceibacterota bacterium]|nr:molybdenum cofactor biosynthesis protein MoaE [Verrucomicrobiota bacterium]HOX04265.1 molybdenum cofactor biosynthesis protein MoaE [Verrucomicrobiota bacterium]HRZ47177.1 molybdenum cofactor biosynthesis protein MoaE [Candidatus Paceibacterota bacterium]HRZ93920.1 molybdenum cofactor biosynthesis protein MoaE [Candidatus Paceibacterota bacterium]
MRVEIEFTTGRIGPRSDLPPECGGRAGAVVEFSGRVRADEDGRPIAALEYSLEQSVVERLIRDRAGCLDGRFPCLHVRVIHRTGIIPVGETPLQIVAVSVHRSEALGMVGALLDYIKEDLPVVKRPIGTDDSSRKNIA